MSRPLFRQLIPTRPHKPQLGMLRKPQLFIIKISFIRVEQEYESAPLDKQSSRNIQQVLMQLYKVKVLFLSKVRLEEVLCLLHFLFGFIFS